jgi:hypothetical protein
LALLRFRYRYSSTDARLIGNSGSFGALLELLLQQAEDISDPSNQKVAIAFFSKGVPIWGRAPNSDGQGDAPGALPGFEQFIYERLIPTVFRVPSSAGFNAKDGQMTVVSLSLPLDLLVRNRGSFRSSMRLPTSYKPFVRREGQKFIPSSSLCFCLPKIGHQKQP